MSSENRDNDNKPHNKNNNTTDEEDNKKKLFNNRLSIKKNQESSFKAPGAQNNEPGKQNNEPHLSREEIQHMQKTNRIQEILQKNIDNKNSSMNPLLNRNPPQLFNKNLSSNNQSNSTRTLQSGFLSKKFHDNPVEKKFTNTDRAVPSTSLPQKDMRTFNKDSRSPHFKERTAPFTERNQPLGENKKPKNKEGDSNQNTKIRSILEKMQSQPVNSVNTMGLFQRPAVQEHKPRLSPTNRYGDRGSRYGDQGTGRLPRDKFDSRDETQKKVIPVENPELSAEEIERIANEGLKKFIAQKEINAAQLKKNEYASILGAFNLSPLTSKSNQEQGNQIKKMMETAKQNQAAAAEPETKENEEKKNINTPLVKKIFNEDRNTDRTTKVRRHYKGANVKKNKVILEGPISIKDLAMKMNITEGELIKNMHSKHMSYLAKNKNALPVQDITLLLQLMNYEYAVEEDFDTFIQNNIINKFQNKEPGSPVIAIVGHIDHGKTSLVEAMSGLNLRSKEAGEITQKVTSYSIKYQDRFIRVIDTPGHSVFKQARNLAVEVCDLAILIIAADEGIQAQTIDSIKFLQENNLPFITVITKIDTNRRYEDLYSKLTQYRIFHTKYGGDADVVPVSAKNKENLDLLMDHIILFADEKKLTSDTTHEGYGYVLESFKDNKIGTVCSIILKDGCIKNGDTIVLEDGTVEKVRTVMANGTRVDLATKYDAISIYGFNDYAETNEKFWICNDKKTLNKMIDLIEKSQKRNQKETDDIDDEQKRIAKSLEVKPELPKLRGRRKRRANRLNIRANQAVIENTKIMKIVLCGDSQNDISALKNGLEQLQKENKIGEYIILGSILGNPSDFDLDLISSVKAYLICFNVNISTDQKNIIISKSIIYFHHNIIYQVFNAIEEYYNSQHNYEDIEEECGTAEIVAIFKVHGKFIAGCLVRSGSMMRDKKIELRRDGNVIATGKIDSLKKEAEDIKEAKNNQECGIFIKDLNAKYQLKDTIVCYRVKRITKTPNNKIISEKYI